MTLRSYLPLLLLTACTSGPIDNADDDANDTGNGNGNAVHLSMACPPADLFEAALCVCDDFASVGDLRVAEGPAGNAIVGINGKTTFVNDAHLSGGLVSYGDFENVGYVELGGSLATAGEATAVGRLQVANDVNVGGDMTAVGEFSLQGSLNVQGEELIVGDEAVTARGSYQTVEMPCACDGAGFFDVGAAVAAAKDNNDNEAAGLDAELTKVGTQELRLETGSYYLSNKTLVGDSKLTISGSVSLFIEGDMEIVGQENIELEDGATLDLFVAGNLETVGNISFGSEADPQGFRLYVGGQDSVAVSVGEQDFFGSIYAPSAAVVFVGDTKIVGSLFAKSLDGVGGLDIEYGSPADLDPESCELPPETQPEPQPEPEDPPQEEDPGRQID